jgi:hypothetical protein
LGDDPFIGHLTLDQFDQVFRGRVWQDLPQPELDWPSGNRRYWKSDTISGQRLALDLLSGCRFRP